MESIKKNLNACLIIPMGNADTKHIERVSCLQLEEGAVHTHYLVTKYLQSKQRGWRNYRRVDSGSKCEVKSYAGIAEYKCSLEPVRVSSHISTAVMLKLQSLKPPKPA